MTEQEWLASEDPESMFRLVTERPVRAGIDRCDSPRKIRLFACACVRLAWGLLADPRSRKAVEVAEAFADGRATDEELQEADDRACAARDVLPFSDEFGPWAAAAEATAACREDVTIGLRNGVFMLPTGDLAAQAQALRDILGNPFRPFLLSRLTACNRCWGHADPAAGCEHVPFRLTPDALSLARAAYEERAWRYEECPRCEGYSVGKLLGCPDCQNRGRLRVESGELDPVRLAVLADCLEEDGCPETALLAALRGKLPCPCQAREGMRPCPGCGGRGAVYRDGRGVSPCVECGCEESSICFNCRDGWLEPTRPRRLYRGFWALDVLLGLE